MPGPESSGRPVTGPAARLLPRLEVRSGTLDARRYVQGAIPHLVEARAAIHRPVVPRGKRNDGLPPAGAADRGMELTWSFSGSSALGCRPARRASLRVVQQALARIERLLARGEGEFLPAVTAGQGPILVHPRRFLPRSVARVTVKYRCRFGVGDRGAHTGRGTARSSRLPGFWAPGLMTEKIRAPSRGRNGRFSCSNGCSDSQSATMR